MRNLRSQRSSTKPAADSELDFLHGSTVGAIYGPPHPAGKHKHHYSVGSAKGVRKASNPQVKTLKVVDLSSGGSNRSRTVDSRKNSVSLRKHTMRKSGTGEYDSKLANEIVAPQTERASPRDQALFLKVSPPEEAPLSYVSSLHHRVEGTAARQPGSGQLFAIPERLREGRDPGVPRGTVVSPF